MNKSAQKHGKKKKYQTVQQLLLKNGKEERKKYQPLCNIFTVEWKEKIINAIKYSKINQQQQTLIKTLMLRMFYYF